MDERAKASKPLPPIVTYDAWREARGELLVEEKAHMRRGDALAARRRRLPMVPVENRYVFRGRDGDATLLELFRGRNQLIVYHFMFHPVWDEGCDGCSWFTDGIADVRHLAARDVSFALVSRAPIAKLEAYRRRMGWDLPWYSSHDTTFNHDFGATVGDSEHHALSVFLRNGEQVYLTYQTSDRGVEHLGTTFSLLDLVPYGRQERWEDSPDGWPKGDAYVWWRRHDQYGTAIAAPSTLDEPHERSESGG